MRVRNAHDIIALDEGYFYMSNTAIDKPDQPDKPKQITKAEKEARVRSIVVAILEGKRQQSIIYSTAKQYGVTPRQAYRYYQSALASIRDNFAKDLDTYTAQHLARLEHVYKLALDSGNLKAALTALSQMSNLLGLDAPKKVQAQHGFSNSDLWDLDNDTITKLYAAAAVAAGGEPNDTTA